MRLACLYVPLFPLAARLRAEPELRSEALAISVGSGTAARVAVASRQARQTGIRPGHTLAQARALLPQILVRGRDAACERSAQEALLEVAESFSPRVEDAEEGTAFLEISGLGRRYRDETSLAQAIERAAVRAALPARVGVASSKLAARVAASLPKTPTLVDEGEEARFLAPLPLTRLTPAVDLAETLGRWGLRSIGEFAQLPAAQVTSRLGEEGRKLHSIARGLDPQPLVPRQVPADFQEGMDCEWPLVTLEPLLFLGRAALERLAQRLAAHGLGCARLEVRLRLDPDGWAMSTIDLPAPTRDVKTLLTLVRLDLESHPPGAPVVGFRFGAIPDRPRDAQLSLLGPADLSPDRLATTLARLFALLGPGRLGAPRLPDGHRPERFSLVPFAPPPAPLLHPEATTGRGLLALRNLRPPLPVEVLVEPQDEGGRPAAIQPVLAENTAQRQRIEGPVRVASGPWRLEEGWWNDGGHGAMRREYWDVELESGGIYRLYREPSSERWFADGIYD